MKSRITTIFLIICFGTLITGCGSAKPVEQSTGVVTESQPRGEQVEETRTSNKQTENEDRAEPQESPTTEERKAKNNVTVVVKDKIDQPQDINEGRYSARVTFVIDVVNNTDQTIQGVQGVMTVNDLFGKEIISTNCNFTGQLIAPGETATFDELGIDINEYIDEHVKLYNEDYDDLSFEYQVKQIVYADEKTQDSSQTKGSKEVTVRCIDKTNIPVDYNAGRITPYAEFTFEVTNNTDKDIRGIQGVLTINDLFGTEIKRINCDFTGNMIPAGETVTIGEKYLDINEFIDDDVKIYNEDYDDMQFEYKITDIIYAE